MACASCAPARARRVRTSCGEDGAHRALVGFLLATRIVVPILVIPVAAAAAATAAAAAAATAAAAAIPRLLLFPEHAAAGTASFQVGCAHGPS